MTILISVSPASSEVLARNVHSAEGTDGWTTAQREGAQCSALAVGSWRQSAQHGAGADHTHGYPHLKSGLTQHVLEKNG